MKSVWHLKIPLLSACVALTLGGHVRAQYTLTDEDVEVVDGDIRNSVELFVKLFLNKEIIIPDTLDGQAIRWISGSNTLLKNKGLTKITLPSTLYGIRAGAFADNPLDSVNLSACSSLTLIERWAFRNDTMATLILP
jgi:hypothetical protein